MDYQSLTHPFGPVYNQNSRVLILGSFPSVKSREQQFFYGHPRNRFWKVMAAVFDEAVPVTVEEKKALILHHHLALWDTVGSCEVKGSSDGSIRNVKPNDLSIILGQCPIRAIYCNGKTSWQVYNRLTEPLIGRKAVALPSTSPANAQWSLERLIGAWSVIRIAIGDGSL